MAGAAKGGSGGGGKDGLYRTLRAQLESLLEGCPDPVARMATASALLKDSLPQVSWAGFYLRQPDGSLLVGPYQGPLACMLLPPGKGVCGAAASERRTVIVDDVHSFPDHIACDAASRSEIVVPLLRGDDLLGVLDLDSHEPAAFDDTDRRHLEAMAALVIGTP